LLSVGSDFNLIFGALQQTLNDHLLAPNTSSYALPLVGANLAQDLSAQLLNRLATAVSGATDQPSLNSAIAGVVAQDDRQASVSVSFPNGGDGSISISGDTFTTDVGLATGLPALDGPSASNPVSNLLKAVESQIQVPVTITYSLNLFFNFNQTDGHVQLDTGPNSGSNAPPLLNLSLTVNPLSFPGVTGAGIALGPITVSVQPGRTGQLLSGTTAEPTGLTFAATFNATVGLYDAANLGAGINDGNTFINLAPGSGAVINIGMEAQIAGLPGLEADLYVTWSPMGSPSNPGFNPFDNNVDAGRSDITASINMWLDTSSVANFLGPIFGTIGQDLKPLATIVGDINDVVNFHIPILSDLTGETLGQLLISSGGGNPGELQQFNDFSNALQTLINGVNLLSESGFISLGTVTIYDPDGFTDDPRSASTLDLGSFVSSLGAEPNGLSLPSAITSVLSGTGLSLPLFTDPATDLQALFGKDVVLVEYSLSLPQLPFSMNLPPIPIFPPLFLDLGGGFSIQGDVTVGYDTFAFTNAWNSDPTNPANSHIDAGGILNQATEGIFVEQAQLFMTGFISLDASLSAFIVSIQGGGKLILSLGIGANPSNPSGLQEQANDEGPDFGLSTSDHPFHTPTFSSNGMLREPQVLQLGDLVWDIFDDDGGFFCPFDLGGALSIDFSVTFTVGFSFLSASYTIDLGSFTLASFSNSCGGGNDAALAQVINYDGDLNELQNNINAVQTQESFSVPDFTPPGQPPPFIPPGYGPIPGSDNGFTTQYGPIIPTSFVSGDIRGNFQFVDDRYFNNKVFPGTQTVLLLDVGDYQNFRNPGPVENMGGPESIEISPGRGSDLLVQGFGQINVFPGLNSNLVTIVAVGADGSIPGITPEPLTIKVDKGVFANAYLIGGAEENELDYQGAGDTYMVGGNDTDPTSLLNANVTTQNNIVGGFGDNYLQAGNLNTGSSADPFAAYASTWNILQGGPGLNVLQGGSAGATLYAGPNNDQLIGGTANGSFFSTFYTFVAGPALGQPDPNGFTGPAADDLTGTSGGNAVNEFLWNESDGSLNVVGGNNDSNTFDIFASTPNETWDITQNPGNQIQINAPLKGNTITASLVQTLNLDDVPKFPGGTIKYQVDDLDGTGIQAVNLNQHELDSPDGFQDQVTINVPERANDVTVSAPTSGLPDTFLNDTQISIGTSLGATLYQVNVAIPKPADTLTVKDVIGDDSVTISNTEGGFVDQLDNITPGGGGTVQVATNQGSSSIIAVDTDSSPVNIFSQGSDNITLGTNQRLPGVTFGPGLAMTAISYPVVVSGFEDRASLTLNDQDDQNQETVTVTSNTVQGLSPGEIIYFDIGSITIKGGTPTLGLGNTFNVFSTASPEYFNGQFGQTTTTIDSNAPDSINVGNGGSMQGIQGLLTISGEDQNNAVLNLDDQDGPLAPNVDVSAGQITGLAPATINMDVGALSNLTIDGPFSPTSNTGSVFNVLSTASGTNTSIFGGGADTVNVGGGFGNPAFNNLSNIDGVLLVTSSLSEKSIVTLNIEDQGDKQAHTVTVTDSSVQNMAPVEVEYTPSCNAINIDGGTGGDTFNVQSTAVLIPISPATPPTLTTTTINSIGADTINVGDANGVQDILGNLVANGNGTDNAILNVNDRLDAKARTVTIANASITGLCQGVIGYSSCSAVNINPGKVANIINVQGTAGPVVAGSTITTITSQASDSITVGDQNGVQDIQGKLVINGSPTAPCNLTLNDQPDTKARISTLTATAITGLAPAEIDYANVASLTIDEAAVVGNGNALTVNGTPAGTALTISTGLENDDIALVISGIGGPVTLNTHVGDTTVLFDGPATGNGRVYTINIGSVTSSDGFSLTINYPVASFFDEGFELIPFNSFNQTFNVQSETFGVGWGLFPVGTGNDTINVGDPVNGMEAVQGDVSVDSGNKTSVALNVNDPAGSAAQSYTLGYDSTLNEDNIVRATSPISPGGVHEGRILYNASSNRIATITFNDGNGGDTYVVQSPPVLESPAGEPASLDPQITFNGGASLEGSPNLANLWQITCPNSGTVDAGMSFQSEPINVSFSGVSSLVGGGGNDTFQVGTAGSLGGSINGGGGATTLDYSQYVGNVTVDLPLGVATAIAGGISNIINLNGSQGDDILVGDTHDNIIQGGTGPSLLIGGPGGANITGGPSGNIVISGSTVYDTQPNPLTAYAAIMSEWTSSDGYKVRVRDIRGGGGLNGNVILNPSTVFDDSIADTLTGGTGLNFYFLNEKQDTITDPKKPGVETLVNLEGKGSPHQMLAPEDLGVALTPAQLRAAYGINSLVLDGSGQIIAIVDAYDDPSIFQALDAFDSQYGLTPSGLSLYDMYGPAASFLTVVNQYGQTCLLPSVDPAGPGGDNWEVETELDVEWAHAIAPGAQIILVETNSDALSALMAGVATAASRPGVSVVSMSWGYVEGQSVLASDEAAYDSTFTTAGVTFLASTGDHGAANAVYPAFSPNVLAVGGSSLYLNADNSYNNETGWGYYSDTLGTFIGGGGGISQYETEPAYQLGVQSTGYRTTPDVSFVANPATGAWIADPYNLDPSNPWEVAGGTSLSAPCWAGLIALVNQGRAGAGEAALNTATPTEAQQDLYRLPQSDYHVISSGYNGYTAQAGYNLVTGLGTPVANLLVPDLISGNFPASVQVAPITATGLVYSGLSAGNADGTAQVMNPFKAGSLHTPFDPLSLVSLLSVNRDSLTEPVQPAASLGKQFADAANYVLLRSTDMNLQASLSPPDEGRPTSLARKVSHKKAVEALFASLQSTAPPDACVAQLDTDLPG
jgi:hypothetical protein